MTALLRLLRFSLAPSLLADLCAGLAWQQASPSDLRTLGPALPCSLLLFSGGMALNARVDLEEDRRTNPRRPLPAGLLPRGLATAIAAGGLLGAPLLAAVLAREHRQLFPGWVAALSLAIGLYHTPWKRSAVLGPLLLGAIRGGHCLAAAVLLRGSAALTPGPLCAAAAYAVYTLGASLVAHQEDRSARAVVVAAGRGLAAAAALALPLLGLLAGPAGPVLLAAAAAGALLLVVRAGPWRRTLAAPDRVRALAGRLLGGLALFGATSACAAGSALLGAVALAAYGLGRVLIRFIPPT